MSNFKLSFVEFIKPDKVFLESIGGINLLLEMAKGQQNLNKLAILWDQDDLKFLHQFPPLGPKPWKDDLWTLALMWRYSEGLLRVAEYWSQPTSKGGPGGSTKNPDVDLSSYYKYSAIQKYGTHTDMNIAGYENAEDIDLEKWDTTNERDVVLRIYHFKKIKTNSVALWEKLQDPQHTDFDLTDAIRDAKKQRDALHQFNSTLGTAQYEVIKRNLKAWMLTNQVGILTPPKEWEGQQPEKKAVEMGQGKGEKFNLPAIQVSLPGYTITVVTPKSGKGRAGAKKEKLEAGQIKEVPADTYNVPVLGSGSYLKSLANNRRKALLEVLGLNPDMTTVQLVKTPLFDTNRTAQDILNKIVKPENRTKLGINDILLKKITSFLLDAHMAYEKHYGSGGAGGDKDLADLSLANLMMTLEPKFSEKAWRKPTRTTESGAQLTAERDLVNLLVNYENISDEDKAALKQVPFAAVKAKQSGHKIEDEESEDADSVWVAGGFNPAKSAFPGVGPQEFKSKFTPDQQAELINSHTEAAKAIIRRAADSGKLAGFSLQKNQIEELQKDKDQNDIAKDVALRAVLSYRISRAEESPGVPMDPAKIAKTMVDKSRIRALLSSWLGMSKRAISKADSLNVGVPGSDDSETERAAMIAGDGPKASDIGVKNFRRRRATGLTSGMEVAYNNVKRARTIKYLADRFEQVEKVWQTLMKTQIDSGKSQELSEFIAKKKFKDALEEELKEDLNGQRTGISGSEELYQVYKEIKAKLAKGEKIEAPKIDVDPIDAPMGEEIPSTLQAVADTSDYHPKDGGSKADGYKKLIKFVNNLTIEFGDKELNLNELIAKMFFDQGMKTPEVEKRVASILHSAKEYFAEYGIEKILFAEKWKEIIQKISDLIQEAGDDEEEPEVEKPIEKPVEKPVDPEKSKPTITTAGPTAGPNEVDKKNYGIIDDIYKRATSQVPTLKQQFEIFAKNPKNAIYLPILRERLKSKFPDVVDKVNVILGKIRQLTLAKVEMSLPMGYPPYDQVKKILRKGGVNAWGTAGPSATGAVSAKEGPIQNWTKKTLKEYLEEKQLEPYKIRLQERLNGKR